MGVRTGLAESEAKKLKLREERFQLCGEAASLRLCARPCREALTTLAEIIRVALRLCGRMESFGCAPLARTVDDSRKTDACHVVTERMIVSAPSDDVYFRLIGVRARVRVEVGVGCSFHRTSQRLGRLVLPPLMGNAFAQECAVPLRTRASSVRLAADSTDWNGRMARGISVRA